MLGAGFIGATRRPRIRRLVAGFGVILDNLSQGAARDGDTLGFTLTGTAAGPQALRWQTGPDGTVWSDVPGATGPTLAVDLAAGPLGDTDLVRVGVTVDGTERFSAPARLVRQAPVATGDLAAQVFTRESGPQTLPTAPVFAGQALAFSHDGPAGVTIDPGTGVLTFDTAALPLQTGTGFAVTAENSGGTATRSVLFDIVADTGIALTGYVEGDEPVIGTGTEEGPLTWTVADGPFAGSYTADRLGRALSIADGVLHADGVPVPDGEAVCLVAATVTPGTPWRIAPGYWLFGGTRPVGPDFTWQRDGADIPGATGTQYTPGPADAGAVLGAAETFGSRRVQAVETASAPRMSQTVTVPAGRVGADLPGFPLRIDLADMPAGWWTDVAADGGNIRARAGQDTADLPLDIVWIDTAARQGIVHVRRDLAAAAATATRLVVADPATAAMLPVTDPAGRNAVWADYLRVTAFPSLIDRTGRADPAVAGVDTGTGPTTFTETQASGDIAMHQGICWTGSRWIAVDTNRIAAFDADWTPLAENADPVGEAGIAGTDHLGDPTFHNGEILIPLETYPNAPYDNQHIAVYDATDLSFVRAIDISGGGREISSFAVSPVDGLLYATDFTDGGSIPRYDPVTGASQGALTLSRSLPQIQGIAWLGGRWYVSDDQADRVWSIDPVTGAVGDTPLFTSTRGGSFEGLAVRDGVLHVLIDATPSAVYRLDPVVQDRGTVSVAGAGRIVYDAIASQDRWTAAITAAVSQLGYNNGVLSVTADGAPGNRTTMLFRHSSNPASINVWSNANGYMAPAGPIAPVAGRDYRLAFGYGDGTRRQWVDGALYAAQSGITHRPGGVMDLTIARKDPDAGTGAAGEALNGTLSGSFWLRGEVMPDAWMEADSANTLSPSTFYTL